jgi:hypothetical protein
MDAHDTTAEPMVTGGGTSAARVHDPASREEEAERVAGDGGEQHAAVEGHDGQHDEVRRAHPGRVRRREQRGRGRRDAASRLRPRAAARDAARGGGERLGERGERQHEEEAEQVRARAALAGPPREQHHRAVAPGEGRVLRHRHRHRHVRGRSRLAYRRRRRRLRRAHALHCCWIFGTGRGRVLGYSERAK